MNCEWEYIVSCCMAPGCFETNNRTGEWRRVDRRFDDSWTTPSSGKGSGPAFLSRPEPVAGSAAKPSAPMFAPMPSGMMSMPPVPKMPPMPADFMVVPEAAGTARPRSAEEMAAEELVQEEMEKDLKKQKASDGPKVHR